MGPTNPFQIFNLCFFFFAFLNRKKGLGSPRPNLMPEQVASSGLGRMSKGQARQGLA